MQIKFYKIMCLLILCHAFICVQPYSTFAAVKPQNSTKNDTVESKTQKESSIFFSGDVGIEIDPDKLILDSENPKGLMEAGTLEKGVVQVSNVIIIQTDTLKKDSRKTAFKNILKQAEIRIEKEYKLYLHKNKKDLQGKIKVKLSINESGKVLSCIIEESSINDKVIKDITISELKYLDFKQAVKKIKTTSIAVTFIFYPIKKN